MDKEIKKEKDRITVEISFELMKILEEVKSYVRGISYDSINTSTYEASKLLAKKINQKGKLF